MFNLIKFEILKRKNLFKTLGVIFLVLQLYTTYRFAVTGVADPLALLFIFSSISYIVFIFSSISHFSKDITSTDRTMVFMVPKSGFEIVSSKFLATMILGIGLLGIISIVAYGNIYYIDHNAGINILNYFSQNLYLIPKFLISMATLGSFFALVFLSIIITKTFLEKIKFRTLIIIVIMSILSKIFNIIFWDNFDKITLSDGSLSFIGIVGVTTIMLWISGWLIDNKTDF